jgi:hypothetical protein
MLDPALPAALYAGIWYNGFYALEDQEPRFFLQLVTRGP